MADTFDAIVNEFPPYVFFFVNDSGIPSIMWSDIINNTQRLHPGATVSFLGSFRRIFTVPLGSGGQGIGGYYDYSDPSSTSPTNLCRPCSGIRVDYMRLTFVIFVCCYSVNELVVIASFIQFYIQDRNVTDFVEHSNLYRVRLFLIALYLYPVLILALLYCSGFDLY